MCKSIDELKKIIWDIYEMDPYNNSLVFFYGKRNDRIQALSLEKDVLTYMCRDIWNDSH